MNPDRIERWERLTPNLGALDPATVIYHAGRASVRTPTAWKWACLGLLVSHCVWFITLKREAPSIPPEPPRPVVEPIMKPTKPAKSAEWSPAPADLATAPSLDPYSVQAIRMSGELPALSVSRGTPMRADPPLSAGSDPRLVSFLQ